VLVALFNHVLHPRSPRYRYIPACHPELHGLIVVLAGNPGDRSSSVRASIRSSTKQLRGGLGKMIFRYSGSSTITVVRTSALCPAGSLPRLSRSRPGARQRVRETRLALVGRRRARRASDIRQ
jgi:hypothetical protein